MLQNEQTDWLLCCIRKRDFSSNPVTAPTVFNLNVSLNTAFVDTDAKELQCSLKWPQTGSRTNVISVWRSYCFLTENKPQIIFEKAYYAQYSLKMANVNSRKQSTTAHE